MSRTISTTDTDPNIHFQHNSLIKSMRQCCKDNNISENDVVVRLVGDGVRISVRGLNHPQLPELSFKYHICGMDDFTGKELHSDKITHLAVSSTTDY